MADFSKEYDHKKVEKKWREIWDKQLEEGTSNWLFDKERALKKTSESGSVSKTKSEKNKADKLYLLDMFPYPSGSGLHVGHVEEKVALDILARFKRMQGENVLMPTGYDSFGLPTENYALKKNLSPKQATKENTQNFHEQTKRIGISYDWSRELATSDLDYYKFTQWWFLFLYERGLAYRKKQSVNWCPSCQTVLANEQVIEGVCERCDATVVQKEMKQWFFKITDYADRLLEDLKKLDWPESTKLGQKNWIGRSEGIEIDYLVPKYEKVLYSTQNKSKVARMKKILKHLGLDDAVKVLTPAEAGLEQLDVEEGSDIKENALKKAKAYEGQVDYPIIAADGGLFIEGEEIDPAQVRRNALQDAGVKEDDLTREEIADLMMKYYTNIVKNRGVKELPAEFRTEWSLILPNGEVKYASDVREILLLDEPKGGEVDVYFPIRAIYRHKQVPVAATLAKEEDYWVEMKDVVEAVQGLLAETLTTFTTRPDTNFGATFIAVAPDSKFVKENLENFPEERKPSVEKYIKKALEKTELERISEGRKKTGEFTGMYAINRLTKKSMPIYVSDFVLSTVGTGHVVGVPGHDKRDFEFAQVKDLEIIRVVVGPDGDDSEITSIEQVQEEAGTMINSQFLDGKEIHAAKEEIMDYLEEKGWGRRVVNYKLRDWSISRQRYWGAPIPILYKDLSEEEQNLNEKYQQNPEILLDFHGYESSPEDAYHTWLRGMAANFGIKAYAPQMPGDSEVRIEEWLDAGKMLFSKGKVFVNEKFPENAVITGRSLGGWAALKFAEMLDKPVRKLVLVAPANPTQIKSNIIEKKFGDHPEKVDFLKEFIGGESGNVDLEKIKKNVGEVVIFLSSNDPYIPFEETKKFFKDKLPFCRVIDYSDAGHFSKKDGFSEFQKIFDEVVAPVDLSVIPLQTDDLPVQLPEDVTDFKPKGTSPLGTSEKFNQDIDHEKYGDNVSRELDTMDTFVCSSWYYYRFIDPANSEKFADYDEIEKIGPVDFYIGGAEHTVLHLLYSRFFTKVLHDAGIVSYDEPFMTLRHQGLILAEDNRKMSKRWGNVINPTDVVEEHGADSLRMYEMFMGPLDQTKPWSTGGLRGVRRFMEKVWQSSSKIIENNKQVDDLKDDNDAKIMQKSLNELVEKITADIEDLKFNTCVSEFMKFVNLANEKGLDKVSIEDWKIFLKLLFPFAPFITSEIWEELGETQSIGSASWPEVKDLEFDLKEEVEIVVMVNGKLREKFQVLKSTKKSIIVQKALKSEKVQKHLEGKEIKKEIFVPDKLLNLVV